MRTRKLPPEQVRDEAERPPFRGAMYEAACPNCGALVGEYCITPEGRLAREHTARIRAALAAYDRRYQEQARWLKRERVPLCTPEYRTPRAILNRAYGPLP